MLNLKNPIIYNSKYKPKKKSCSKNTDGLLIIEYLYFKYLLDHKYLKIIKLKNRGRINKHILQN